VNCRIPYGGGTPGAAAAPRGLATGRTMEDGPASEMGMFTGMG
jgi:hypothetical protein